MSKFLRGVYCVIIPLLIIGISFGYTSFDMALAALLPLLFMTNRHTVGIFFIMYGGPLCGVIRAMYPSLPVYGLLFELIGFWLVWDLVVDLFRNNLRAFGAMALLLAVFGLFYLIGPRDEWAADKYYSMCINGMVMIGCYYAYCRSAMLDAEGLLQLLFVAAVCMFAYVISSANLIPGQITDYNWFRSQLSFLNREYKELGGIGNIVGYQQIGILLDVAS